MNKKVLNLSDISKIQFGDFKEVDDIFVGNSGITREVYSNLLQAKYIIDIDGVKVSSLNLPHIGNLSDDDIVKLILDKTGVNIETKEGVLEINDLFQLSKDRYVSRLFGTLRPTIQTQEFKTKRDIIDFLKLTSKSKIRGTINCVLARVMLSLNSGKTLTLGENTDNLDERFINRYIDRPSGRNNPFEISYRYKGNDGDSTYLRGIFKTDLYGDKYKDIKFTFVSRTKSVDSRAGKYIADIKSRGPSGWKDAIRGRFICETYEDLLIILQYLDLVGYKNSRELINQGSLPRRDKLNLDSFNRDFIEKIEKSYGGKREGVGYEDGNKKKESSKNFKMLKLQGKAHLSLEDLKGAGEYEVGVEIQGVVGKYIENGLSSHIVYDQTKIFREKTELLMPISELDIISVVNDLFYNLDNYLKKVGKDKGVFMREVLFDLTEEGYMDSINSGNINTDFNEYYDLVSAYKDEIKLLNKRLSTKVLKRYSDIRKKISKDEKFIALGLYSYFKSKLIKVEKRGEKGYFYIAPRGLDLDRVGLLNIDSQLF